MYWVLRSNIKKKLLDLEKQNQELNKIIEEKNNIIEEREGFIKNNKIIIGSVNLFLLLLYLYIFKLIFVIKLFNNLTTNKDNLEIWKFIRLPHISTFILRLNESLKCYNNFPLSHNGLLIEFLILDILACLIQPRYWHIFILV